jgi:hypothetical protein
MQLILVTAAEASKSVVAGATFQIFWPTWGGALPEKEFPSSE